MPFAVVDKEVDEELRGFFHDGIGFAAQESAIHAVLVVFPVVKRQPRATHRPNAVIGVIDGRCIAPGVQVVMKREAAGAVHFFGRAPAAVKIRFDKVEERPSRLRKIADLGRPVVHLEIDVGGVFAVPRRSHAFVPDALQVGGHGAGTAAPHQEIAAELEVERSETGIFLAFLDPGETLVDGKGLDRWIGGRRRHLQVDAAEELLVVCHVPRLEDGIRLGGAAQVASAGGGRIASAIVGRGDHDQSNRVGVGDGEIAAGDVHLSAFVDSAQDRTEFHAGRFELVGLGLQLLGSQARRDPEVGVGNRFALQDNLIGRGYGSLAILRACERGVKRQLAGLVADDAHDQRLVRRGGEHFARVCCIADAIGDAHNAGGEVQLAAVAGGIVLS